MAYWTRRCVGPYATRTTVDGGVTIKFQKGERFEVEVSVKEWHEMPLPDSTFVLEQRSYWWSAGAEERVRLSFVAVRDGHVVLDGLLADPFALYVKDVSEFIDYRHKLREIYG